MLMRGVTGIAIVGLVVSATAFAQTDRPASSSQPRPAAQPSDTGTMKFVGCLIKESDYRSAHKLGKGTLGTGVGIGDEYVLVDATSAPAASGSQANAPASSTGAKPAAGRAENCTEKGTGTAYRMTGKHEEELKSFVGRRMEIFGKFEHASDVKAAADPDSAKLPAEVEIASFSEAPALASAAAPAAAPAPSASQAAPAPSSAEARNQNNGPAPQVAQSNASRELPRTASDGPLIALIGLISLTAGVGLSVRRRLLS